MVGSRYSIVGSRSTVRARSTVGPCSMAGFHKLFFCRKKSFCLTDVKYFISCSAIPWSVLVIPLSVLAPRSVPAQRSGRAPWPVSTNYFFVDKKVFALPISNILLVVPHFHGRFSLFHCRFSLHGPCPLNGRAMLHGRFPQIIFL